MIIPNFLGIAFFFSFSRHFNLSNFRNIQDVEDFCRKFLRKEKKKKERFFDWIGCREEGDLNIFLLVAASVLIASSTGVHLGLSWGPIRTDRILTRVMSASKEILFTTELWSRGSS